MDILALSSGESELQQLEENLLALRRGDVAISSGQPLATVTLKLDRPDQARQVIDQVLREANLQAFQKVLPGQAPDRQIILVPRQDIERLEQAIRKPGTWVVLLRSAANVLRGERVVYAFPDVRPNVAITMEGEVLAKTTLASQDTNPEAVRNRINLLLASTLAEVRRRGSLSQGLQFDANAVNTLARELTERSGGLVELEAVAAQLQLATTPHPDMATAPPTAAQPGDSQQPQQQQRQPQQQHQQQQHHHHKSNHDHHHNRHHHNRPPPPL